MAENPEWQLPVERARRQVLTFFVCAGSVLLVGLVSFVWNAIDNHWFRSTPTCASHDPSGWYLLLPEIAAVALVLVTRRHAHRWYVLLGLGVLTFVAAVLMLTFVMIVSTPCGGRDFY